MRLLLEYIHQFGQLQRNARLYLISNVLSGVTTGILLVLYNLYLVSLGYGTDFIGAVLFVGTLGAGIAIFPAGIVIDRLGGKAVMIWSSLLLGLIGVGQILFRQPIPLLLTTFIAGVAGAALLVVNAPYLTANSTPEERTHLFSLNITLSLITIVLGKVLGGVLPLWFRGISWLMAPLPPSLEILLARQPEPRSYQLALLLAGIIAGPSLIPLFLLSNDRPIRQQRMEQGQALGGNATADHAMPVPPTPGHAMPAPPAPGHPQGVSLRYALRAWVRNIVGTPLAGVLGWGGGPRGVLGWGGRVRSAGVGALRRGFVFVRAGTLWRNAIFLLILVQVFIGLGAGLFTPYFNIYFVEHLGASSALFGLIDGGANAITALLTLAAPLMALRLGKIRAIAFAELASIPFLLTIGLTSLLPLAAILYLFRQGLMDMSNGVLQVFSMEAAPKQHRGFANSGYQAAFQVAWAITAPIGGLLIAHVGYPPIFLLGACCYLLAIATLWFNFGRGQGQKGREEQQAEEGSKMLQHL